MILPMNPHRPERRAGGFLLIEVLAALVILSVAMTAALAGMSRALKIAGRSESFAVRVPSMEKLLFDIETGARTDLVETGGVIQTPDVILEIESVRLGGNGAPDPAGAEPPSVSGVALKIRGRGLEADPVWDTEVFMGKEIFS